MAPKPAPLIRTWACKGRDTLELCSEWPNRHEGTTKNPINPPSFPGDFYSHKYHHGHQETGAHVIPHTSHYSGPSPTVQNSSQQHKLEHRKGQERQLEGGQPLLVYWGHSASGFKCQREEGTAMPLPSACNGTNMSRSHKKRQLCSGWQFIPSELFSSKCFWFNKKKTKAPNLLKDTSLFTHLNGCCDALALSSQA